MEISPDVVGPCLRGGTHALWTDGDLRAARDWFDAAHRIAERENDPTAMAEAALGLAGLWVHEQRSTADGVLLDDRLRRALSRVDDRSALALRLRARLAGEADYRRGGAEEILAVVDEARRAGHPVALADAVSLAHHCLLGPGDSARRHALARELIAVSFRTERPGDRLLGMLWHTVDLFLDGDPHAERRLQELRERLADQEHQAVGYVVEAIDVMRTIRDGRLDDAERRAGIAAARGRAAGDIDADGWFGAHMISIRWFQGRIAELRPVLRDLADSPTLSAADHSFAAALAVAEAAAGDRRAAAGALARMRGGDLPRSSSWLAAMYGIVEAAHVLGDAATAAGAYELLRPYAGLPMTGSIAVTCFGSAEHALGVAALTGGDPGRAVDHLRAAVRDNTRLGHWPAVALSRSRLAAALARRGGSGDAAEAQRERALAVEEATGMGMALPAMVAGGPDGWRGPVTGRRRGRFWEIEFGGRRVEVAHSIGLDYLATLLANPGREVPAVDLAAGPGRPGSVPATGAEGPGQPVIDDAARRAYRKRLSDLQDEIDELEDMNDTGRVAMVRAEREWLIAELAAATGLGGRARRFAGNEERARISVTKAIRRAVARVADADPVIGAELDATVVTGVRCGYRPR